jgi:hypothetical protein
MLTLKLWRALHNPPSIHPLFRRIVVLPSEAYRKRRYLSWANLIIALVVGLGEYAPTILFLFMPLLLFVTGIIYGLDCALRVSSAIAREHENKMFQLLALAPPGPLGTSWTMCASALYRNREFDQLHMIVRSSLMIAVVLTIIIGSLVMFSQSAMVAKTSQPALPTLINLIHLGGVFIVIYAEYIQSALLGCLVGMLIPTYAESSLDAGFYAFGLFMLLQISGYFLTALLGFYVLSSLYAILSLHGMYAEISLTILRVAIFILIREAVIRLVWRHLTERLNAQASEFDYILQTL